ncbi:MAG: fasciclin domain-containing protein [Chloroflexota bacterium]
MLHEAIIVAAGLADTLASADETFTVFAPTDAAFAALEAAHPGILDSLFADPEGALACLAGPSCRVHRHALS